MSGWWDIPHLSCFNVKLWSNSMNRTELWMNEQAYEWTERQKLYTLQHKYQLSAVPAGILISVCACFYVHVYVCTCIHVHISRLKKSGRKKRKKLGTHLQWFSNDNITGYCDVTNAVSLIATITSYNHTQYHVIYWTNKIYMYTQ